MVAKDKPVVRRSHIRAIIDCETRETLSIEYGTSTQGLNYHKKLNSWEIWTRRMGEPRRYSTVPPGLAVEFCRALRDAIKLGGDML